MAFISTNKRDSLLALAVMKLIAGNTHIAYNVFLSKKVWILQLFVHVSHNGNILFFFLPKSYINNLSLLPSQSATACWRIGHDNSPSFLLTEK